MISSTTPAETEPVCVNTSATSTSPSLCDTSSLSQNFTTVAPSKPVTLSPGAGGFGNVFSGLIIGIVIAVVVVMALIVAVVAIATVALKKQVKNTSPSLSADANQAYGVTTMHEEIFAEESVYAEIDSNHSNENALNSINGIEVNEAYATNIVPSENEAYIATNITTDKNLAYGSLPIFCNSNPASREL